jgi:O-antigen/teichoic acid export membrane protein
MKIKIIFNIKKIKKSIFVKLFKFGFPLIFLSLFMFILSVSDRYMILYFINREAVGIYSPVYDLFNAGFSFIYTFLVMAGYPMLIHKWELNKDIQKATIFIKKMVLLYIILIIPVFIFILLFDDIIIQILSESYSEGKNIIPWIILGFSLFGFTYFFNKGIELRKKTNKLALMVITSGIINIGLNLVLIPKFGIEGAAISTCFSYLFYFLFSLSVSRYYLSWKDLFSLKMK